MGYHVTILRTVGGKRDPIRREEISRLASSRSDLALEEDAEDRLTISVAQGESGTGIHLFFDRGEIWTKNPDPGALQLMLDLARPLGARVRGDELETYRTVDDHYVHPEDRQLLEQSKIDVRRMRLRARLISYSWFVGAMGLACAVGFAVDRCTRGLPSG
jgi:hypothetical protein